MRTNGRGHDDSFRLLDAPATGTDRVLLVGYPAERIRRVLEEEVRLVRDGCEPHHPNDDHARGMIDGFHRLELLTDAERDAWYSRVEDAVEDWIDLRSAGAYRCWCGDEVDAEEQRALTAEQLSYRTGCAGLGFYRCLCGGDFCVCHNHGDIECPGCRDCRDPEELEDWEEEGMGE